MKFLSLFIILFFACPAMSGDPVDGNVILTYPADALSANKAIQEQVLAGVAYLPPSSSRAYLEKLCGVNNEQENPNSEISLYCSSVSAATRVLATQEEILTHIANGVGAPYSEWDRRSKMALAAATQEFLYEELRANNPVLPTVCRLNTQSEKPIVSLVEICLSNGEISRSEAVMAVTRSLNGDLEALGLEIDLDSVGHLLFREPMGESLEIIKTVIPRLEPREVGSLMSTLRHLTAYEDKLCAINAKLESPIPAVTQACLGSDGTSTFEVYKAVHGAPTY